MDKTSFFGSAPLWIVFFATVVIIVLSIYLGIFISRLRRKNVIIEDEIPVDTIVGATLALLGFIPAFIGFTSSRFDSRRQLLLEDVNSIGTTYLRAGFLSEPHCSEVRNLVRWKSCWLIIIIETATTGCANPEQQKMELSVKS